MKKAMQLSLLSDCDISLQIFWKEDGSLVEYNSDKLPVTRLGADVSQHVKFLNENFKLLEELEHLTVKHGHMFSDGDEMTKRMYSDLEGFNLLQLFSLVNGKGSKNTLKKCIE